MYEASFESILKTVLIIMLIYFGFKLLIKWFGPMILKYFLKRIGSKFQQQFNQQPSKRSKKEGDVVIEKKPNNSRKANKKVGEYIDYEEID
ncbi:protein of unknown function [Gillisia sp. Hel1_33_143]|uniref:DUF4834 family protein n=1 Tax=unclassified Gillisia TaxID=2615025 RepID=UPI00054F1E41|nr:MULTISPECIES: DUF4834 family protein [unclassified Gillisia]SDS63152.1 protein of unknown function [Gillisia sp. Hel1_33_143]